MTSGRAHADRVLRKLVQNILSVGAVALSEEDAVAAYSAAAAALREARTGLIQKWAACRRCSRKASASQRPILTAISGKLHGSGIVVFADATVVCAEELVTVVVPSSFTSTVKANPLVVSVVRTGIVPAASENMLKANLLPDVDVPSGELNAGPNRPTWNDNVEPYLKPSR